jgi:ATP/maltotriose-dependent transcriptional regulator MalT
VRVDKALASAPFIARPRVEQLIRDTMRATPITVLHAPLGAGKSVAMAAALAGRNDVARLEIQPWHRSNFVDAMVQAVRAVRADFGRRALGALDAAAAPSAIGQLFAADLRHVRDPLILAVDASEHLADDDDFAAFLEALLPSLPDEVRLIFAGRTPPPLTLSTALVRRRAAVLGADLFAFTRDETIALAQSMGSDASAACIDAVARETDGWATGVALALQPRAISSHAPGTDLARAFLEEALLPRLAPATLAFLEETSLYQTLDAAVLHEDAAATDFELAIRSLERAGAPIVRRSSSSYRVHALLRALALDRLRARNGESSAHARASSAFAKTGNLSAALFHAHASGDEETVDRLLRTHANSLVRTANAALLSDTMESLQRPESQDVYAYVKALIEKGRGEENALEWFERARTAAKQSGDAGIAFAARAQIVERSLGQLQVVSEAELADLETRAAPLDPAARAQTAMYRGWQRAIVHDFGGALHAIEPLRGIRDVVARLNTGVLYAYAQIAQGDIDLGLAEMDALVRLLEDDDRIVLQTLALIWQARLALLAGRTTVASDAGRAALLLVESLSVRAEEAALYVALAELATHDGDLNDAVRYAERASTVATHAWYAADASRARGFADIALARAAFLGHDNAIARDLALRAAHASLSSVQRAVAYAEAVVYASLAGAPDIESMGAAARAALVEATPVDAADAVMLATSADVLSFMAAAAPFTIDALPAPSGPFAKLIERRRGLVTLEHAGIALTNFRNGQGTHVPFDLALERMAADGPRFEVHLARAYAAQFIHVVPEQPATSLGFELTPRESEILELLVGGLSNKEIAQRLVLSPRTAETHVERVLGKLGVPSRSRAIAKALRLGLVTLPAE